MYDAVKLYVQAINSLSSAGLDFRKGKKKKRENRISEMETGFSSFNLFLLLKGDLVVSLLRGRSYHSAMGYNVFMDYNGDAEGNYTLIYKRELPTGKLGEARRS